VAVDRFDRVRCVNDSADIFWVFEELTEALPVVAPGLDNDRILVVLLVFKLDELGFGHMLISSGDRDRESDFTDCEYNAAGSILGLDRTFDSNFTGGFYAGDVTSSITTRISVTAPAIWIH